MTRWVVGEEVGPTCEVECERGGGPYMLLWIELMWNR
jgi:hypothetical protein